MLHNKIEQRGTVFLDEDVEVGANTTIVIELVLKTP